MQETRLAPQLSEYETIERKARHFVHWWPTVEVRLASFGSLMKLANNLQGAKFVLDYNELAKQLFAMLEKYDVLYLVIGGYAARAYGVPRFTDDIDLFIEGSPENIEHVLKALVDLGSSYAEICLTMKQKFLTLLEIDDLPLKTDLMVTVPGLNFQEAWQARSAYHLESQKIYLISREDLIKAKRAAGRWQDLEDVKALEATKP